jgi:hypothetical protein
MNLPLYYYKRTSSDMKVLRCMMKSNTPVPAPPSASSSSSSLTPSFASNSSSSSSAVTLPATETGKPSWIYFKYDRNLYSYKIFHTETQWFVCDSWLIDDFVHFFVVVVEDYDYDYGTPLILILII